MTDTPLRLLGAPGSPYTRKMRALMRYRRIPFHFVIRNSKDDRGTPAVPVALIPVLVLPGEGGEATAMIDSTFQIRRLDEMGYSGAIDHHIQSEKPLLNLIDHGTHLIILTHIALDQQGLGAHFLHLPDGFFRFFPICPGLRKRGRSPLRPLCRQAVARVCSSAWTPTRVISASS